MLELSVLFTWCILLSGLQYSPNAITPPPEVSAATASDTRPIYEKIDFEKWVPAIDKMFGKVEDWKPIGVKSVRIIRITTTTTTTLPTTTTTKPTTTTTLPTTTTMNPKPQRIKDHAGAVLRRLNARGDIINRIGEGILHREGPRVKVNRVTGETVDGQSYPYYLVGTPQFDFTMMNVDERGVTGTYFIVFLNYNRYKNHYMIQFEVTGDNITMGSKLKISAYKVLTAWVGLNLVENYADVITIITFRKDLGTEGPSDMMESNNFDIIQFMNDYSLEIVDATAFGIQ